MTQKSLQYHLEKGNFVYAEETKTRRIQGNRENLIRGETFTIESAQ